MIRNYIKTAVRNLLKNKTVTLINILGLAIGLAAFIIILTYTSHELSYDKFHDKADRIYRGLVTLTSDQGVETGPQMVAAAGPSLKNEFPEVEEVVRFRQPESRYLSYDNKAFFVKNVLYSDSTLFDVFSFRLLQGNPRTALDNPFSIVLSARIAGMIFGSENPVGKMITLDNKDLLTVTGVVEDAPSNSHIQYNAFISFSSLYKDVTMHLDWNGGWAFYTYVLLSPGTDPTAVEKRFPQFMDKHINYIFKGTSWSENLSFQPLLKIYLHSRLQGEIGPVGNLPYLILFSFIAMVIFIIACINFINLTSARLTTRLRETGVRKVHGATRGNILLQFLTESVVLNLVSLLLAFIIAESVLPVLNAQLGLHLVTYQPATFYLTLGVISAILTLGILAGSYPALYLTSYNEVESIKNIIRVGSVGVNLRKVTVLLQYCVSVAMIICTLFLFKQLHYINHRDPGFDRKNIVALPLSTSQVSRKHELLKSSFSDIPSVEYVAVSSDYPGRGLARNGYTPEGYQDALITSVIDGDEDLLPVLGLKVVQGRNFSASYPSDGSRYLVNEAYVRSLNWENPLGRYIERNGKHEVIGIVGDFNFAPLHERIAPLIITMIPEEGFNYMLIRVMPGQMDKVLADIRKKWESLVPELPFEYFYLEDALRTVYSKEQHLSELVLLFTILAIFIAFLGLFGLSSYETVRQTKNIGIRKVNGAGSGSILLMLCTGFLKWVLVAFIFACPLAYYTMQWWLRQFAYKTTLSLWVFVAAGLFALVVALITVSWQSFSAASKNPVDALRYE